MRKLRNRLRQSSVIGLLASAGLLVLLLAMVPERVLDFFNVPGLLTVVGGTVAATLISRPFSEVRRVFRRLPALLHDDIPGLSRELNSLVIIADHYRHGHLRAAEDEVARIDHDFLRTGVQLVLDRSALPDLMKVLQWRTEAYRQQENTDAQVLRSMAAFAPAFGMLGTLFGLVQMLHALGGSNLTEIGVAMGFALMTTLYGIVFAYMFLKPLAMKIERRTQKMLAHLAVLQEGVLMLYERQHPTLIRETLSSFLAQHQDVLDQRKPSLLRAA